ncbi:MAG: ion transporter [Myxococcota bacterium]
MFEGAGDAESRPMVGPFDFFLVALSFYVLAALAIQSIFRLDPQTIEILDIADTAICVVFLIDFLRSLARAEDLWRYLRTWGWVDLLSSIPAIDVLRWGRAARVFRLLRVLRAFRSTRVIAALILQNRAQSAFWATSLLAVLVTVFGSISILHLERIEGSNIRTAQDALWWSFVTVTTVGYGDHYPVTQVGRVLAASLMVTGIGIFGTFTAFVASRFVASTDDATDDRIELLRAEVADLRRLLEGHRFSDDRAEASFQARSQSSISVLEQIEVQSPAANTDGHEGVE